MRRISCFSQGREACSVAEGFAWRFWWCGLGSGSALYIEEFCTWMLFFLQESGIGPGFGSQRLFAGYGNLLQLLVGLSMMVLDEKCSKRCFRPRAKSLLDSWTSSSSSMTRKIENWKESLLMFIQQPEAFHSCVISPSLKRERPSLPTHHTTHPF
jgi:hypothetical protein